MTAEHTTYTIRPALLRNLVLVIALGALGSAAGLLLAPVRIWPAILLANYYIVGLALAGGIFIALTFITRAGWSTVFRRVPEAMTRSLPVSFALMLLTAFGISTLYEWSHTSVLAQDHLIASKAPWLNVPFFVGRIVVFFVIWIGFTAALRRNSELQDRTGDERLTDRNMRISALFLVLVALTIWLASTDWIMSLEAHWFSTIFGVYHISGILLTGTAALTALLIGLKRRGVFGDLIRPDHLHDLGKLMFAFSTFWMYIWFSQYMLIWYSNIPEETGYYLSRQQGGWLTFTILNVVFNWLLPFVALLSARAKRAEGLLLNVSVIILIGHWIDLFWMIAPPFMPDAPSVGLWEVAPLAAAVALFLLITLKGLTRKQIVPVQDPTLVESLHYHS
ncbi:MAG: hypothetical protein M5R41_04980 [Bacteroidia bacterium]|nr:hypothetical protein [Bacteroidia bacterium]